MEITFAGQPAPRPGVIPPQVSSTEGYDPRFPGAVGYSDDISMSRSISGGFLSDTLPRNVYLYFLFTMPLLYASRVDEILEGVEETKPEVQRRAAALGSNTGPSLYHSAFYSSEAISRLLKSWDFFVGSLVQEWATLNIVSVLLSSAIITTLQLDGAVTDPYTRYFALLALVCSLMSILYGCIYIIRFNTLRRSRKIMGWSKRVQKTEESIWWNVRILLATLSHRPTTLTQLHMAGPTLTFTHFHTASLSHRIRGSTPIGQQQTTRYTKNGLSIRARKGGRGEEGEFSGLSSRRTITWGGRRGVLGYVRALVTREQCEEGNQGISAPLGRLNWGCFH